MEKPSYRVTVITHNKEKNKPNIPFTVTLCASGAGKIAAAKILAHTDESVDLSQAPNKQTFQNLFLAISPNSFDDSDIGRYNINAKKSEFTAKIAEMTILPHETGDHLIYLTLTYTNNNMNWYTDRLEYGFHVNSHAENYHTLYIATGTVIALLSLISIAWNDIVGFLYSI